MKNREIKNKPALLQRGFEAGIPVIAGIIVCILIFYTIHLFRMNSLFREEAERTIAGISGGAAAAFEQYLGERQGVLALFAQTLAADGGEAASARLLGTEDAPAAAGGFARFSVSAGADSAERPQDGICVSGPVYDDVLQTEVFVLSEPLAADSGAPLTLNGMLAVSEADAFLAAHHRFTDEFGSVVISAADGAVLCGSVPEGSVQETFFEALLQFDSETEGFMQALQNRENGAIRVKAADTWVYMAYEPLSCSGWYFITVMPESALSGRLQSFFISSVLLCAFVLLAVFIMSALFGYTSVRYQHTLQTAVFSDPLLDGGNGIWFALEARKLITQEPGTPYVLVRIDIDALRVINESFGRAAGDWAIRHVYRCIGGILTAGEIAARDTEDAFLLLMKYYSNRIALERLELLSRKINSREPDDEHTFLIGLYAGLCAVSGGADIDSIKDKAAIALSTARRRRTGSLIHCAFFKEEEREQLLHEKSIEKQMTDALANKEFIVYVQPKYALETGGICGAEALVRWIDPERGLMLPGQFIPFLERSGFVLELDAYVFETVCALLRRWIDGGRTPCVISVNVSEAYIEDESFLDRFEYIRTRYGVPAAYLELELSGTAAAKHRALLSDLIARIHELGYQCSLDDFGSAGSLNALGSLPVDVLKLSRSFFGAEEDAEEWSKNEPIIESVLELARRLHIRTVAEGVESDEQAAFLRRARCDMAQGYLYSGPVTAEAFERMYYAAKE